MAPVRGLRASVLLLYFRFTNFLSLFALPAELQQVANAGQVLGGSSRRWSLRSSVGLRDMHVPERSRFTGTVGHIRRSAVCGYFFSELTHEAYVFRCFAPLNARVFVESI